MINIPYQIFDRNINEVNISFNGIYLFSKDEIHEAQLGFTIGPDGNDNPDWLELIGTNCLIIGIDTCCGDPIFIDTDDKELPVYSVFHDDWDMVDKIANSFQQFLNILTDIDILI